MEEKNKSEKVENCKKSKADIQQNSEGIYLNVLLPKLLDKNDTAYKSVEELNKVITFAMKEKRIRNIALTGPYGSGKSSILQTFCRDHKEEKNENGDNKYKILNISLATLQSENNILEGIEFEENLNTFTIEEDTGELPPEQSNKHSKKKNTQENLSRRIEYSILQQIIYKEEASKIPNSRFSRIIHKTEDYLISKSKLLARYILSFAIAFIVVFEPKIFKVETIYNLLNLGKVNIVFDIISSIWMLYCFYLFMQYIITLCYRVKWKKLSLNGISIELEKNTSIFNKYFDEILYFFQANPYNIVIIEDLDRFKNPDLFLKLREVNFLLNESNAIKQHIIFVYAVKDDVFINEDRTKFFDYIIPIIPVINISNSEEKLIELMRDNGCDFEKEGIREEDLSEISLFIHDMRILKNIVNEYKQYKTKIISEHNQLSNTKLLAIIVYKNYFPENFTRLHKNKDCIYYCMKSKKHFIELASLEIDKKQKILDEEIKYYETTKHLKENDLRYIFLQRMREMYMVNMTEIFLNNNWYNLQEISQDEALFMLIYNSSVIYCKNSEYNDMDLKINCKIIDEAIDYTKRMQALNRIKYFDEVKYKLKRERLDIEKLSVSDLLNKYNIGSSKIYKDLNLPPMVDVFIRQGLIEEDYNDYISFFYTNLLTESDRKLLVSIKQNKKDDYTYSINRIENFVKRLNTSMFTYDAILNNDILDFISVNRLYKKYFILFMEKFEQEDSKLDFLSQYYLLGKQPQKVFEYFIKFDKVRSWNIICKWQDINEKNNLIEAWLKYTNELDDSQKKWLYDNYNFIVERSNRIGLNRCKEIVSKCYFKNINTHQTEILDWVIANCSFEINTENLTTLINHLNKSQITSKQLNLTRITSTNNDILISYVKDNIEQAFMCFSKSCKDESKENIIYLLSQANINNKNDYLSMQDNKLDYNDLLILGDAIDTAFRLKLVKPSWENIAEYLPKCQSKSILFDYIKYFTNSLINSFIGLEQPYCKILFETIFSSNDLAFNSYNTLCHCFQNVYFDGQECLLNLKKLRINCLINNEKLPFTESNIKLLQKTEAYADFLIYHKTRFINNITKCKLSNVSAFEKLIHSNKFTDREKALILKNTSDDVIFNYPFSSDIIKILLVNVDIYLKENILKELIRKSEDEEYKVKLVCKILVDLESNKDEISEILTLLGSPYNELYDSNFKRTLNKNKWNKKLLKILKERQYINFKYNRSDKNKYKIIPFTVD